MRFDDRSFLQIILSGAAVLLSVLFHVSVVHRLGIAERSDLYYAATLLPLVLYAVALGPINNVLIPMFVERMPTGQASSFLWVAMASVLATGTAVLLAASLLGPALFPFMFRGLEWKDAWQVGSVALAYSAYQTLYGLLSVKTSYLFAIGRHLSAQANVCLGAVFSVTMLWCLDLSEDVSRVAWCLAAGTSLALVFPNVKLTGLGGWTRLFKPSVGALYSRVTPLAVGAAVFKTEALFDGMIASMCGRGSLTIYALFQKCLAYIVAVIHSGYIQPGLKSIAETAREQRPAELKQQAWGGAQRAMALGAGFAGIFALLAGFVSAAVPHSNTSYLWILGEHLIILPLLSGYVCGALFCKVYANLLYVLRAERIFVTVSISIFAAGIALKLLGGAVGGLHGLATATSAYWVLYSLGLWRAFHSRMGHLSPEALGATALRLRAGAGRHPIER